MSDITNEKENSAPPEAGADAEAPAQERSEAEIELDRAQQRIVELEGIIEELTDIKNEAARAKADLINYRQRVERDKARDRALASEGACDALLPVLDNLDRTLAAMEDHESPIWKGVSMVQKQFLQALLGLGLTPIATDCPFDPKVHEAVGIVEVDDASLDGKIVEVLNQGYRLGDKLLRASLVKIGKKK